MWSFKNWKENPLLQGLRERLPLARSPVLWKLLLVLGSGILMLVYANSFMRPQAQQATPQTQSAPAATSGSSLEPQERELGARLEQVLSSVVGAGQVKVTVTLSSGPESVYAHNSNKQNQVIQEKDQAGGNRTTTDVNDQESLVFGQSTDAAKDNATVEKVNRPSIAGVLVLAEGARNAALREKLALAVETALDIPPHKVTVLPKESW
jgi:stage III sporulation protein AG